MAKSDCPGCIAGRQLVSARLTSLVSGGNSFSSSSFLVTFWTQLVLDLWPNHSSAKQVSLLKEPEFNEGPQHYCHEGEATCKASQNLDARKVDLEGSHGSVLIQARKGWLRSHRINPSWFENVQRIGRFSRTIETGFIAADRGCALGDGHALNGERQVDLCCSLAKMLRGFVGKRTEGLLFRSSTGAQLLQSNTLGDSLHPVLEGLKHAKGGFNIFRRFRTHLEKDRVSGITPTLLVRARTETRIRTLYQTPRRAGFSVGMGGESWPWFRVVQLGQKRPHLDNWCSFRRQCKKCCRLLTHVSGPDPLKSGICGFRKF